MIESTQGPEAMKSMIERGASRWMDQSDVGRLSPIYDPLLSFDDRIDLVDGEPVFTIGSCFARNVEAVLDRRGHDTPLAHWRNYRSLAGDADAPQQYLNKYCIAEIAQELEWAQDRDLARSGRELLLPAGTRWMDPHGTPTVKPAAIEVVEARRKAVEAIYSGINKCRLAIITLGMSEVWWDEDLRRYMNAPPPRTLLGTEPDRFSLRTLDYGEISDALSRSCLALKELMSPGAEVWVTVSPVPLASTGRGRDVILANSYSKAVQRAAAEEVVAKLPFVHYFPSYEMVLLSDADVAFESDRRHVRQEMVDFVMACCIRGNQQAWIDEARALALLKSSRDEALGLLEGLAAGGDLSLKGSGVLGLELVKAGAYEPAERHLELALAEGNPPIRGIQHSLGIVKRHLGDFSAAVLAGKKAVEEAPQWGPAWFHLGLSLRKLGALSEAAEAFKSAEDAGYDDHRSSAV